LIITPPGTNTSPEEFPMDARLTTTGFGFEGYRIVESLGVVRGISVRSRSVIGSTIARLQTIVGGNITFLTQLCERTREEAFEILLAHAERVGANAVVGVRYDSSELMPGVSEVLCYGTAVVLEQVDG
jgi:uncharacterized protein YbjQ (UPF0145 family)